MKQLRFFISSTDKLEHDALYEQLCFLAKSYGVKGTTVYRGLMGYGESSSPHAAKFWTMTEKVPIVVEMIDEEAVLRGFLDEVLPKIKGTNKGTIVTLQDIDIVWQQQGQPLKKL